MSLYASTPCSALTDTCRNYDEAIRVMQRASAVPKNPKVNYHDHVGSHTLLFRRAAHKNSE